MRNILTFILFLLPPYGAALTGVFFKPGVWYLGLNKPIWTPPALAFPIIWTILYFFMGITFYQLYQEGSFKKKEGVTYFIALLLNALWSPIFFGAHRLWVGFIVILCLWGFIAYFIFLQASPKLSKILNSIYLLWLTIALSLNLFIALNNDGVGRDTQGLLDQYFEQGLKGEVREAFKKFSPAQVRLKTSEGYHRLEAEDLYQWNRLRLKMGKINTKLCSAFWKGGVKDEDIFKAMESFNEEELKSWARISGEAFKSSWLVKSSPDYPEDMASKSLLSISLTLPKDERNRFFEGLQKTEGVDEQTACWLFKKTLNWIDQNRGKGSEPLLYFFAKKLRE